MPATKSAKLKTVSRIKRAVSRWSGRPAVNISLADSLSAHRVEPPNSPGLRIDVNTEMGDMNGYVDISLLEWNASINGVSSISDVYALAWGKLP